MYNDDLKEIERIDFDNEDNMQQQLVPINQDKPILKLEKLVKLVTVLENNNNLCESEIDRIKEKKKSNDNKIKNIKNYLLNFIDDKPLFLGTFTLSKLNSVSTEIVAEKQDLIPDEFMNTKITKTPDKTKIKDYLNKDVINSETGEIKKCIVDWAYLKKNVSLKIK